MERATLPSEHSPDVCEEGVVAARVSPHTVDVRGGAVEFGPVRILQADTEAQPGPERWAAVAEWQGGKLKNPTGAVWAPGKRAVKRRIRGAAIPSLPAQRYLLCAFN